MTEDNEGATVPNDQGESSGTVIATARVGCARGFQSLNLVHLTAPSGRVTT